MTRTSELSTRRDAQKVSPSLEMLMKYEHDKVFTHIYLPLVMLRPAWRPGPSSMTPAAAGPRRPSEVESQR